MLRRTLLLTLALALWATSALSEGLWCVNGDSFAALVDETGADVAPEGAYRRFVSLLDGALYAGDTGDGWALLDGEGQPLSVPPVQAAEISGGAVIYRRGGLYGAMTPEGRPLVDAEWRALVSDGAGGFLALRDSPLDDTPDAVTHIDASGEARETGLTVLGGLNPVWEDRMAWMDASGRYGYADGRGNIVIAPVWLYAGAFSNGAAAVTGEDGRGLIGRDGEVILSPNYAFLARSEAMILAITPDGDAEIYSPDGRELRFALRGEAAQGALAGRCAALTTEAGTRLFDAEGHLLCEASAGAVFSPGCGGQILLSDGVWGEPCQQLLDADGTPIVRDQQCLLPLCGGRYAALTLPGVQYYSDDLNAPQTSWDYAAARWALMDDAGQALTDAVYLDIRPVGDDRLLLLGETEATLTDLNGAPLRVWEMAEEAQ